MTAAVVLAAGFGTRMGGPKALLLHEGVPLVRAHVLRLAEAGATEIVVVAHPSFAARVQECLHDTTAILVAAVTGQQAESLGVGLASLRTAWQYVWIAPVDTVPADLGTFAALQRAIDAGAPVANPRIDDQGGHPVLARRDVVAPYLGGLTPRLRDLLEATTGRARVPVHDAAVTSDLDAPRDLATAPRFA